MFLFRNRTAKIRFFGCVMTMYTSSLQIKKRSVDCHGALSLYLANQLFGSVDSLFDQLEGAFWIVVQTYGEADKAFAHTHFLLDIFWNFGRG